MARNTQSAQRSLPESGFVRAWQLVSPGPLGFSRATLDRKVKDGSFPKPVKLGPQITAWRVEDVRAWMAVASAQAEVAR